MIWSWYVSFAYESPGYGLNAGVVNGKSVAYARQRHNMTRPANALFKLTAEVADMHVYQAQVVVADAPYRVEQMLIGQHPVSVVEKLLQQIELDLGQMLRLFSAPHLAPHNVDRKVVQVHNALVGIVGSCRAPQHRADPGCQLSHMKRLGDIVVGSKIERGCPDLGRCQR